MRTEARLLAALVAAGLLWVVAPPRPLTLPPPEQLGLAMPSPQQLGVAPPRPASPPAAAPPDWAATRAALQRAGALGFQLDRLPDGAYRFVCVLPPAQAGGQQRVES